MNIKNIMFVILLIVYTNGFSQNLNQVYSNYIEVTGSSEISIIPNEIYLSIKLKEKHGKNEKSIIQLETILKNVIKKLNIPTENLSVTDASSKNIGFWYSSKEDIIISKNFILKLNDTEHVSLIYKELENNEISNVNVIKTNHTDIAEFRKQVKIEALKAAKDKADYLLSSVNQELGKLIYVKELSEKDTFFKNHSGSNTYYLNSKEYINKESTIYFEKIKLRYEIIARFEIN